MARHARKQNDIGFAAISVVGGLISPDKISQIASVSPDTKTAESYSCPKGTSLRDEIARYFRIGQAEWQTFSKIESPTFEQCTAFAKSVLEEVFGFSNLQGPRSYRSDGHSFKISLEDKNGRVPVVVAPPATGDDLDGFKVAYTAFGDAESGCTKRRPDALLQEWLNASDPALWGIVFAGDRVRLMRDNASFTRPTYIEADLGAIFRDEMFADFTAFWLLIHATRFGNEGAAVTDCPLERWREEGVESGTAARDRLRENVEEALLSLGQGFIEGNPDLRDKLDSGTLSDQLWFEQLLRIVYRLIFIAVTEERDLLHEPDIKPAIRKLYAEGYSFAHMRERSTRRTLRDPHGDVWEGARILFRALDKGQPKLGLPALGGIFDESLTQDLNEARIANKHFLNAIYRLSFVQDGKTRVRINWRDMATEELGSVYEGLLELVPTRTNHGRDFAFAGGDETRGNARKTSGSYYTPDSLVQALLDSALDPVLDKAEANGGVDAILDLTVIDPACGSAHFLLGAARRIAERVAKLRDSENPDFQHALRDVVRRCIYGVDRNPMAVELAKVALWIEAVEPGKPLGFLDANIRCGDSLLGVLDLETLRKGIPDEAYKELIGDEKSVARGFANRNRGEREGQGTFDFDKGAGSLPPPPPIGEMALKIRHMPEETTRQVKAKAKAFHEFASNSDNQKWLHACDVYVAAFLMPKVQLENDQLPPPTTGDLWGVLKDQTKGTFLIKEAKKICREARAFHWPLEFPDILAEGGFDLVIGNPPWEKYTVLEREFFSGIPEITSEANAAKRRKVIKSELSKSPTLASAWTKAQRDASAKGDFVRFSNRFPNAAVGELNLYPLFAELGISISKESGFVGLILKSLMFTGSTWKKFTDELISSGKLHSVFDFKNWEMLFASVGYHERYSLATIGQAEPLSKLRLAVGLTNPNQLSGNNSVIEVGREFPKRVNPDTGTLPQCETSEDLRILTRVADALPTLGHADWNARYSSGLHMTGDADELVDRETLESKGYQLKGGWFVRGDDEYAPVYEGKLIHQYDHRFATFDGIARERRFGIKAATINPNIDQKLQRNFEVVPRYWVSRDFYERNTRGRGINYDWNIGFRDTTNVISNFRTAVACIVGPAAFNYKCPNILISQGDPVSSALFLSMFNSTPFDYLLRQKFYGANLTKSILMQSFVVNRSSLAPFEEKLLDAVVQLTNTSESVQYFCGLLSREQPGEFDLKQRIETRAWIDALYFRLFGFELREIPYVFDTFPIWKEKSTETWGAFLEQERALAHFAGLSGASG